MNIHRHLANVFYRPFPEVAWRAPRDSGQVYLTFDDGPYPALTGSLLSFLEKHHVPATFFLSGENIFKFRAHMNQLDYGSHRIGSHGFYHKPLTGKSRQHILKDIRLASEMVTTFFDTSPDLFRPPYGMFNRHTLPVLKDQGLSMVLWSLMSNDFKWPVDKILRHLKKNIRPGDVIVFHDSCKTETVLLPVLETLIPFCRKRGWRFGKL